MTGWGEHSRVIRQTGERKCSLKHQSKRPADAEGTWRWNGEMGRNKKHKGKEIRGSKRRRIARSRNE